MKLTKKTLARIHKVRRRALGGTRAMGWDYQARGRRIRRPDPDKVRVGKPDATLTGVAGLAPFGVFLRRLGLDRILGSFDDLKPGSRVVYPMGAQLRLLLDAAAVGEQRVFGIESLGSDPLFVHLAGGSVPSVDTLYRDLCRVHGLDLAKLEIIAADQGLAEVRALHAERVHLDVDTTVEPLFGHQEGALPGPNPRYHGRPSYHPLLGVVAERRRASARFFVRAIEDSAARMPRRFARTSTAFARQSVQTPTWSCASTRAAIARNSSMKSVLPALTSS